MLEKEIFVAGKELKFPADIFSPNPTRTPAAQPGFTTQSMRRIGHQGKSGFQWLAYIPAFVNQVQFIGGLDVLSGPFNGCWMLVYRMNGLEYVGHIGTVENKENPDTVAAKTAWCNFALDVNQAGSFGFQPHLILANPTPAVLKALSIPNRGQERVFGFVTSERKCFSALCFVTQPNTYRVAVVQQMQPRGNLDTIFF